MVKKTGVEWRGGASRGKLHTRLYCTLAYNVRYGFVVANESTQDGSWCRVLPHDWAPRFGFQARGEGSITWTQSTGAAGVS